MSENLFGLTVAADKGLDDLQCQRLLSENRRYQEVMLQYRCALKALESRLEILKAGTVEACGKHAHLLKQSPTYRKMIEKSNLAEKFNY